MEEEQQQDPEVELTISKRLMQDFNKEFNQHFPQHILSPIFSKMIQDRIEMAAGIATCNTVEQIIEFLKVAQHCEAQLPITMIIEYLKSTNFQYHKVKTNANGRFKIQDTDRNRNAKASINAKA